jgi:hypothetical protein
LGIFNHVIGVNSKYWLRKMKFIVKGFFILFFQLVKIFTVSCNQQESMREPIDRYERKPVSPDQPQPTSPIFNNTETVRGLLANTFARSTNIAKSFGSEFTRSDAKGEGIYKWLLEDKTKIATLVRLLVGQFLGDTGIRLDPRDEEIISVLKKYLDGLYYHVPVLEYARPCRLARNAPTIMAIYNRPYYNINNFKTRRISSKTSPNNQKDLVIFFNLFLAGAHFVLLEDSDFHSEIAKLSQAAKNKKHSHYRKTPLATVYPRITWEQLEPAPIIVALLVDSAIGRDGKKWGTFFQLEGWPVHEASKKEDFLRHGIDFATHMITIWNISSYGMSPYSEKRGTTIFITQNPEQPPKEVDALFFKNYDKKGCSRERRWRLPLQPIEYRQN